MATESGHSLASGEWSWHQTPWERVFLERVRNARHIIRVACPFIKLRSARLILSSLKRVSNPGLRLEILTRLKLTDCQAGVHDVSALRLFNDNPLKGSCTIRVRFDNRLHAKLYMFDDQEMFVTSSNLTYAGFNTNLEVALCTRDKTAVRQALSYFTQVFAEATPLDAAKLSDLRGRLVSIPAKQRTGTEQEIFRESRLVVPSAELEPLDVDPTSSELVEEQIARNIEEDLERTVTTIATDNIPEARTLCENRFYEDVQQRFGVFFGVPLPSKDDLATIFAHKSIWDTLLVAKPDAVCARRWQAMGDRVYTLVLLQLLFDDTPERANPGVIDTKVNFIRRSRHIVERFTEIGLGRALVAASLEDAQGRSRALYEVARRLLGYCFEKRGWPGLLTNLGEVLALDETFPLNSYFSYEYKSILQQHARGRYGVTPSYETVTVAGPDHEAVWTVRVVVGTRELGQGSGSTKRSAECAAAFEALKQIPTGDLAALTQRSMPEGKPLTQELVSLVKDRGKEVVEATAGKGLSLDRQVAVLVPRTGMRYVSAALRERLAMIGAVVRRLLAYKLCEGGTDSTRELTGLVSLADRRERIAALVMHSPLGRWLKNMEDKHGLEGATSQSSACETMDALLGALHTEYGFEACLQVGRLLFGNTFDISGAAIPSRSVLQARVQESIRGKQALLYEYEALHRANETHKAKWRATIWLGKVQLATAEVQGTKKQAAEQASATALKRPDLDEIIRRYASVETASE